jgi:hypothetical protein
LNDDTTVIAAEWLTAMLEHAQRPEVGAVGAQLWYPNNLIQHAGVVMGIYGNCSHAFKGVPGELPHYYFDFPNLIRNCSAVTGACLLVAREKFFEAGAFDEVNLAVAFQDVDLCLKLLELGYRNVYTPYAKLYHYESATKTEKDKIPDPAEDAFMKKNGLGISRTIPTTTPTWPAEKRISAWRWTETGGGMSLIGCVDILADTCISGWAADDADPDKRFRSSDRQFAAGGYGSPAKYSGKTCLRLALATGVRLFVSIPARI